MTASPLLRVAGVWKSRGRTPVLQGIDLDAEQGQAVCLLGPSGAGKSTLLRCINALEPVDRGLITLGGELIGARWRGNAYVRLGERALSRQRAAIGMVFQTFNLFPHMSVLDNITDAPVRVLQQSRAAALDRAHVLLARVGLADKAHAFPRQLSGGQQQRVAIARALAMDPKLMLFDEPTSALDPHLVGEVLDVIRNLTATGMTTVIVTHEIQFARELADVVAVMVDGAIVETGPPGEVLARPRDSRVRAFLARALTDAVPA